MSEKMYPIPFKSLMNWIVTEYAREGEIFGVHTPYYASGKTLPIFSERIETPFGPAAGPNSQLAQNIIAAYFAGARFFEVKTVQKMDGAELAACVPRPVYQGVVCAQDSLQGLRSGRPQRIRVQHVRRL